MAAIEEPKKPMTTFFLFLSENRDALVKELGEKAKGKGAVSSYAAEKYKSLSEEQKKVYEKKSADAKAAYAKAMEEFKAQGGQAGEGRAEKRAEKRARKDKKEAKAERKAKAVDMPKRPVGGAHGCYVAEHRASIQASLPGKPVTMVVKVASERFNALSEVDKKKYEKQYQEKKTAFEEAMKVWKAKQDAAAEDGEEEEDGEEGAEDAAADDDAVLAVPSPAKKARLSASSSKGNTEGNEKALSEAKTEGLALKLKSLLENPKMAGKDAGTVLNALRKAGGKVVEARKALLA